VRKRWWLVAALLVFVGALQVWQRGIGAVSRGGDGGSRGSGKNDTGKGGRGAGGRGAPASIVAVLSHTGNIGVYFTGLGSVTPIYTANVRARVDGELTKVYYREGDMVRTGDPLVEIDPRPFQVQLEQAEGQLKRDQALLNNARIDLLRYQKLLQENAVQEQLYTTQKATVAQLEGEVSTDQGAVDAANLNLIYCHITAAISGRIGLRLVDPGNIVHATDTNALLVITQIDPISALFTIAEGQLQEVLRRIAAHRHLRAFAYDREDQHQIAPGMLATVDNQIDPATGTLRLRANFDNRGGKLFPNQFVNVRLLVQEKHGVVLLPTAAIQRTTTRTFVYVVRPDSTVTVRSITEGVTEGDESEITSGLAPGETVVLMGVDKLEEGSLVQVHMEGEGSVRTRGRRGGAARSQTNSGRGGVSRDETPPGGDRHSGTASSPNPAGTAGRGGSQR
jgi:multidrug efflux system membrane fusion protein